MPAEPVLPVDQSEASAGGLDHPECLAFDRAGFPRAGGGAGQITGATL